MKNSDIVWIIVGTLLTLAIGCVILGALSGCTAQVTEPDAEVPAVVEPCAIGPGTCWECRSVEPGTPCGERGQGRCAAVAPECRQVDPCTYLLGNGEECAPGRHCQQKVCQ